MEPGLSASLANLAAAEDRLDIAGIKTVVANYLHSADESSTIETTDYFNHTFSPDLVIRWGRGEEASRRVFIRADTRAESLREDLHLFIADEPLVIPLADVIGPVGSADDANPNDLESESRSRGAMVSPPRALESLRAATGQSAVSSLFATAVVRGGRGVLDARRADAVGAVVARGYEGAQSVQSAPTAAAVETIEGLVSLPQAVQVTRLLQAVWLGAGGTALEFPGATGLQTAQLDVATLQFLLDLDNVQDSEFWSRVSKQVDLAKLQSLRVPPESGSFQKLAWAAFDRLRSKGVVFTDDGNPFLAPAEMRWYARGDHLALQAHDFRAGFAADSLDSLNEVGTNREDQGLSIRVLLDRLQAEGLQFSELRFSSPTGSVLTLRPASQQESFNDELLSQLAGPLEANASVTRINVGLPNDRELICNFETGRANGRTAALYSLPQLLNVAFPMLQPLSSEQAVFIEQARSNPDGTAAAASSSDPPGV